METLRPFAARAFDARPAWPARVRSPWPILLVTLLLFGVSGGMLWLVGYNYDGLSGGVVTKIHPATYLTVAIYLWNAMTAGNPVAYAVRGAWLRPCSFLLVVAMATLFGHIVSRAAPGMAGAIDTFLAPPLLVVLLADIDARGMARIELTLHALMTINALLALLEFVIHMRFFPYRFDGAVFPFDTRSSALQGHPLVNAAVTACYSLTLLNGGRCLSPGLRLPLFGLQFAALVTFGGRAAMVITLIIATCYLLGAAHRALRAGRIPILAAASAFLMAALVPVVLTVLAARGFFDALLSRFVSDGGSANARVEMFSMFDSLSFHDLLIGPDTGLVESLRRVNGLEWGIEQPIIKTVLYQGLMIAVLMTAAVAAFLWEIARVCAKGVWLPMLPFVILLQTSESIAGKTNILSKFAVLALCLYRVVPTRVRPAASPVQVPR